jgi:chromosome segregation ATPase
MTNESVANQLLSVVQTAIGNTALTAETLGKFAELQKQFEAMQAEKIKYEDWWKGKTAEMAKASTQIETLTKELNALRTKIEKAEALEQQSKMDTFQLEFYKARGNEMRGILSEVFRNIQVHRSITRAVGMPTGGYVSTSPESETETSS